MLPVSTTIAKRSNIYMAHCKIALIQPPQATDHRNGGSQHVSKS